MQNFGLGMKLGVTQLKGAPRIRGSGYPGQDGGHGMGAGLRSLPEITPVVGHNVGVPASFQDEDFLLKGGNIIICKEARRENPTAGKEYAGEPGVLGSWGGVWGRISWDLSSPGSIFTIFSATRSPVTLSRAL